MAKKEETIKKASVEKKFLSLFKKDSFFRNKETVADAEFREKKQVEAEIMMNVVQALLKKQRGSVNDSIAEYAGDADEEIYLYDFLSEVHSDGGFTFGDADEIGVMGATPMPAGGHTILVSDKMETKEPKIKLKPIDVFHELEKIPNALNMENLDEKIAVLKMKVQFIKNNRYAKKEVIDMITRLENRKKYKEFEKFFSKFDTTDTDKVNALVNRYELVLKTSDLFIPKFPKEAMDIMQEYKDNVKKLCGKSPIFYVIAEKAMFKSEEKRNGPILLVQSPFGIFWNVLGAWDKELVLLEEL